MVFSSITFLYIFLPIMLLLYFIVPSKLKNAVMILASLIFFAWGEIRYILIMLILAVMDFVCGNLITKNLVVFLENKWYTIFNKLFPKGEKHNASKSKKS